MRKSWMLAAGVFLQTVLAQAETVTLQPVPGGTFRFKDIAGQVYSAGFIGSFSYNVASVTATLDAGGNHYLSGSISATGLKPNFAYQIKLVGVPSPGGAADADDAANERLGRMGRWWRVQPNAANSNDTDYDANKNSPGYIYEGYLLMAFFVTDDQGRAEVNFAGNSSLHVLWRTDQRSQTANDGPAQALMLTAAAGNAAYDTPLAARAVTVYGEWEPGRVLPGKLEMPAGHYHCRLRLTEESFHDMGDNAGNWATAFDAPLDFDIPGSGAGSPAGALEIAHLGGRLDLRRSGNDSVRLNGRLTLPDGLELNGADVRIAVNGLAQSFVLKRSGMALSADGFLQLRRKYGSSEAAFVAVLRRGTLSLPDSNPQQNMTVTLSVGAHTCAGTVSAALKARKNAEMLYYKK